MSSFKHRTASCLAGGWRRRQTARSLELAPDGRGAFCCASTARGRVQCGARGRCGPGQFVSGEHASAIAFATTAAFAPDCRRTPHAARCPFHARGVGDLPTMSVCVSEEPRMEEPRRKRLACWSRKGAVVQLVGTPACHTGSRAFESRPLRQRSACSTSKGLLGSCLSWRMYSRLPVAAGMVGPAKRIRPPGDFGMARGKKRAFVARV